MLLDSRERQAFDDLHGCLKSRLTAIGCWPRSSAATLFCAPATAPTVRNGSLKLLQGFDRCPAAFSGRVMNYKDAEMALRWTAAGFLEAEKSFKKLRGHADLKTLIKGLHPNSALLKKAA